MNYINLNKNKIWFWFRCAGVEYYRYAEYFDLRVDWVECKYV